VISTIGWYEFVDPMQPLLRVIPWPGPVSRKTGGIVAVAGAGGKEISRGYLGLGVGVDGDPRNLRTQPEVRIQESE
jgi:hypothetical protein